jgi:hypothetical protein
LIEPQGAIPLGTPSVEELRQVVPANPHELDLEAYAVADHPTVARILREGWLYHIPLSALTSEKCRAASFLDYSGPSEHGKKTQLALDASGENALPLGDWLDAWPRFCAHIARYLRAPDPAAVGKAFSSHFNGIMQRYDFKEKYWLYLEYDIHIRTLWESRPGSFSPEIFYEKSWSRIVDTARDRRVALGPQFHASSHPDHRLPRPNQRGPNSRGGQSFRGRGIGTQRPSERSHICYVCGDPGHLGKFCSLTSNGYLTKVTGVWRGAGDTAICFRFNSAGCTFNPCSFQHVCSRCGVPEHSAQNHP